MRSVDPLPGSAWPHGMVISVDQPHHLDDLLWVREAHALDVRGADLPPLLDDPPAGVSSASADDRARWAALWPFLWDESVDHAAQEVDATAFERVQRTAPGSTERMRLLRMLSGPSVRERLGDDAFDARYRAWSEQRFRRIADSRPRRLEDEPERRCLAAVVPAWEAGLTRVVEVPCRGDHVRVIGPHALLLTVAARADPVRYTAALELFAREAPLHPR